MSSNKVTNVELRSLTEVIKDLTKGQRAYIYYRLMGLTEVESIKLASRKEGSLHVWQHDEAFRQVETFIMANLSHYAEEAFGDIAITGALKAQEIINHLLELGLSWDEQSRTDKPYIMQAVNIARRGVSENPSDKESYEEMIHRVRRRL